MRPAERANYFLLRRLDWKTLHSKLLVEERTVARARAQHVIDIVEFTRRDDYVVLCFLPVAAAAWEPPVQRVISRRPHFRNFTKRAGYARIHCTRRRPQPPGPPVQRATDTPRSKGVGARSGGRSRPGPQFKGPPTPPVQRESVHVPASSALSARRPLVQRALQAGPQRPPAADLREVRLTASTVVRTDVSSCSARPVGMSDADFVTAATMKAKDTVPSATVLSLSHPPMQDTSTLLAY